MSLSSRQVEVVAAVEAGATSYVVIGGVVGVSGEYVRRVVDSLEPAQRTEVRRGLERNRQRFGPAVITAFGETKTASAWERDPRCVVSRERVGYRVRHGWPAERAITEPPMRVGIAALPTKELQESVVVVLDQLCCRAELVRGNTPELHPNRIAALKRDRIVLRLLADGHSMTQIADALDYSKYAVQKWVKTAAARRKRDVAALALMEGRSGVRARK
jgi:DNA-binding CsgD family transcriptional regulator